MVVQNRLGEPGRAGREVDRRVVLIGQFHLGRDAGLVGRQVVVVLRERRTVVADVEQQLDLRHLVNDFLHAADELRAEQQRVHVGQIAAIANLLGRIAVVQRNRQRAGLEDAEVDRQPLQTVHQQDRDLVAAPDAAAHQQVRAAVRLFVEHAPGDLPAKLGGRAGLDQLIFLPRHAADLPDIRVDFHQRDLVAVFPRVLLQQLRNGHLCFLPRFARADTTNPPSTVFAEDGILPAVPPHFDAASRRRPLRVRGNAPLYSIALTGEPGAAYWAPSRSVRGSGMYSAAPPPLPRIHRQLLADIANGLLLSFTAS